MGITLVNPNRAFKHRHVDMIRNSQREVLIIQMANKNIIWNQLCLLTLQCYKEIGELTALEATRCVLKAGIWENLKKIGYVQ